MKLKQSQIAAALGIALVGVDYNNGIQGLINPKTIPHDKWTPMHGQTLAGEKVNSPKVALVPDSKTVVIEDEGNFFSMSAASFEVMCVGGAKSNGYDVKATTTLRAATA